MNQADMNTRLVEIRKLKESQKKRLTQLQEQLTETHRRMDVLLGQEMEVCAWIAKSKAEKAGMKAEVINDPRLKKSGFELTAPDAPAQTFGENPNVPKSDPMAENGTQYFRED